MSYFTTPTTTETRYTAELAATFAAAYLDTAPYLPAAEDARIHIKAGRKFAHVSWSYDDRENGGRSVLFFVAYETGEVFRAKSWKARGRSMGRNISEAA